MWGGVFDGAYPTSKTRRGRVTEHGQICPTITAEGNEIYRVVEHEGYEYAIRKLTPLECWRLMGWDDESFHKAEAVNSNTQLYKQAGNGIVVDVLAAIFKNIPWEGVENDDPGKCDRLPEVAEVSESTTDSGSTRYGD